MTDANQGPTRERLLEIASELVERLELIGSEDEAEALAAELGLPTQAEALEPEQPEPRAAFSSYVSAARDLNENLPDSLPMTEDIRTPSDADEVLETFEQHAEALRRERTAPVWIVPAPWDGPTLELEPEPRAGLESHPDEPRAVLDELDELARTGSDAGSLARVMLAAGALYARGCGSLSACMRTAVLWERG